MKICYLTHDLRHDYGSGVFSKRLIEGVRGRMRCEVIALTSEYAGVEYERPLLIPHKYKFLREIFRIRRIFKECDIIHALDGFPYGAIAAILSVGLGKPLIITGAGTGAVLALYKRIPGMLLRWSYRRADRVTAISNFTKQEMTRFVPDISVKVVNHGVDVELFQRADGSHVDIKRFQPYILSVGTLRWRKGYDISIRAFAQAQKKISSLHYVIVGKKYKNDYYRQLQTLIDELHLKDKIHILERIDIKEELADIYKGAELFCLFSQNHGHDIEGFGLVFLEAAAAGIPVVGIKNCGVEDAVLDGENGYLVEPRRYDDPNAFTSAIIKILEDEDLKKRMAASSLAFAKRSTWDERIGEYVRIYKKLIK